MKEKTVTLALKEYMPPDCTHYEILDNSYDYLANRGEWFFQEQEMPFYIG